MSKRLLMISVSQVVVYLSKTKWLRIKVFGNFKDTVKVQKYGND